LNPAGPFLGVLLHSVGGLAAGSFYIPFRKVKAWAWESYWLIQGVLAWVVMPSLVSALTVPHLVAVFSQVEWPVFALVYLFGLLWGIGGLTFGLSMRYLGMSLGYAVALGLCAAVGTLVPPMLEGEFLALCTEPSGLAILAGVAVCLAGISICGYAGIRKEREVSEEEKKATIKEFALAKGLAVATFAGVLSGCMAIAFHFGKPISNAALETGTRSIFTNNPVFIVAMAGGFTTNFIWCLILNFKNKSIGDYVRGSARLLAANYAFAGMAGIIWYGQFFFYGMGTTMMGAYDFSSWTIHMAFIIVFSNLWGIRFKEWKGVSRRTLTLVYAGIAVLILSTMVVGYGNYLKHKAAQEVEQTDQPIGEPARATEL
jgi:L-rhamnose-H+ transport protein